jgi:predicted nucleic acid-binding Zn ribbon protein
VVNNDDMVTNEEFNKIVNGNIKHCGYRGELFNSKGVSKQFCSTKCYQKNWHNQRVETHRDVFTHCVNCGIKMPQNRVKVRAKYCSNNCRREAIKNKSVKI